MRDKWRRLACQAIRRGEMPGAALIAAGAPACVAKDWDNEARRRQDPSRGRRIRRKVIDKKTPYGRVIERNGQLLHVTKGFRKYTPPAAEPVQPRRIDGPVESYGLRAAITDFLRRDRGIPPKSRPTRAST